MLIAHTQSLESIYAFWGALLAGAMPAIFPTLTEKLDPAVYMANMTTLVRLSRFSAVGCRCRRRSNRSIRRRGGRQRG